MKLFNLFQESILGTEPLIHPHIALPPRGKVADRVGIYINGFYKGIEIALQCDFANLAELLGEEKFASLSQSYVKAYPSCSFSLNDLGQHLVPFLKENEPYKQEPHLAEIASLEWAEAQAAFAADAELVSINDLQAIPVAKWPELVFYLHPSASFLQLEWNSLDLAEALRQERPSFKAKKLKAPLNLLIWRRQSNVLYSRLSALDFSLLKAFAAQATFLDICEQLSEQLPEAEVATYLVNEIHSWLEEGLLVKG